MSALAARLERLDAVARWWEQTRNPLYAWEAIALALNGVPALSVPDWCLPYLAEAAMNVTKLQWGYQRDIKAIPTAKDRAEAKATLGHDAIKAVAPALLLVRERSKNAFQRAWDDAVAMRAALDIERGSQEGATILRIEVGADGELATTAIVQESVKKRLEATFGVDGSTATRKAAKGKKLISQG